MSAVKFHEAAAQELTVAAAYYESQQPTLGRRFLLSVHDAVERIVLNPQLYPKVFLDVRRCLVRTFPFGVIFREIRGTIVVLAIMHLHRDPDYWKNR
jgi:toxin ParE1/3/4